MSKRDLSFYNIKANEIFKKEEEKPKEELKEEPKKAKVGRPFLEDKKLSKQVAVYLNASEYRSLKARTRGGSTFIGYCYLYIFPNCQKVIYYKIFLYNFLLTI